MPLKQSFGKLYRFLFFILFTTFFFLLVFFLSSFFSIRHILIRNKTLQKKAFIQGIAFLEHKNIFFLSPEKIGKKIIESNPQVKNATVEIKMPNTLIVGIEWYKQSAYLRSSGGFFLLSPDGRILEKQKDAIASLPIISYYQKFDYYSFSSGQFFTQKDIKKSLYFLDKLQELNIRTNSIDIGSSHVLLFKTDGKTIAFSSEKNEDQQRYELESVIKKIKTGGMEFKSLDFRFDKPIIVF